MITCYFSCKKCGLVKHEVQVPARESAETDIVDWMENTVLKACGIEHDRVSPNCHPDKLQDLMIPTWDSEFIGQQIE